MRQWRACKLGAYAQLVIAGLRCQDNKVSRAGRGGPRSGLAGAGRKAAMPGLKDRLTDAGYGLGWSVVCRLPESWAQGAFRLSADLAWRRRGPRVQVLEGNLRRVIGSQAPCGQLRGLSRQVMRSYARYWLEAFQLPVMPADRLVAGVHDTGHLRAAFECLADGRGVIFALPHMGRSRSDRRPSQDASPVPRLPSVHQTCASAQPHRGCCRLCR